MTLTVTPSAIARASDADHAVYSRMRAHIYISHTGLEYRS